MEEKKRVQAEAKQQQLEEKKRQQAAAAKAKQQAAEAKKLELEEKKKECFLLANPWIYVRNKMWCSNFLRYFGSHIFNVCGHVCDDVLAGTP